MEKLITQEEEIRSCSKMLVATKKTEPIRNRCFHRRALVNHTKRVQNAPVPYEFRTGKAQHVEPLNRNVRSFGTCLRAQRGSEVECKEYK